MFPPLRMLHSRHVIECYFLMLFLNDFIFFLGPPTADYYKIGASMLYPMHFLNW